MKMREYLDLKAVSGGVIDDMVNECPMYAWWHSPWNPDRPHEPTKESDLGTIAHAMLLEGTDGGVEIIDPEEYPAATTGSIPDGWTNAAIRAARDAARERGKIPILSTKMDEVNAMVGAARAFLRSLSKSEPAIYEMFLPDGGVSEETLTWEEDGTLCKMRPDRISNDRKLVVDYKTTAAGLGGWDRTQFTNYYVGAAFYRLGIEHISDCRCDYVYLVQSTKAPYLCRLVGVDPRAFEIGASKVHYGLREWAKCAAAEHWPSYGCRVEYPELPAWEESQWQEREFVEKR